MAVIPDLPGVEANIVVDGETLKEYNDDIPSPPKTISKYIEAKSGAVFEIEFKYTPPFSNKRAVSMIVAVDGNELDEPLLRPREILKKQGHRSCGPLSSNGRLSSVQRYSFSALDIGQYGQIL